MLRMKIQGSHFYFVRHAQTLWNQKKLCQGIRDVPLSDKGRRETVVFAKRLSAFSIECICSSPLSRATETATMIHKYHPKAPLMIVDELKERNWGDLMGMSSSDMYAIEMREEEDPTYFPGRGVESRDDLKSRLTKGLNRSFECHPNPLLVSHGRAFLALCDVLKLPPIRQVKNLELLRIHQVDSSWVCDPVELGDVNE